MSLNLEKSHWKRVTLGEVATASREKVDPTDGSVERYVAGEHMDTDDLRIRRWGDVGETDLGPAFHRRFRAGQVLYGSRRTYLRKVAVADFDGVCSNTTFVVGTRDGGALLQQFLPFVMTSEPFHAFAIAESKGSVNPYVNWSDIERYEFDLPPFDDQKRISDLLWAVEADARSTHEARTAAIAAKTTWLEREISALLERAAVPFSETWSRSPESGWSVAPVDEATGRYVLSLAALGPEGYRSGNLKNTPDTVKARAATLRSGDLLISRANTADTVGRAGIYSEDRSDVSFPDTMMRVSLRGDVLAPFAVAVLGSEHGKVHMRRSAAGSATSMVKINRSSLGRLRFPVASMHEQASLLADLGRFGAAIAAFDAETKSLAVLRSSLLADIFGGK